MKANNDKNEINKPRKLLRGILIISKFLFERTRSTSSSSSNFTLQFSLRERREYPGREKSFFSPVVEKRRSGAKSMYLNDVIYYLRRRALCTNILEILVTSGGA